MDLIIDGYNLIFQCGLQGRSNNSQSLERARERLIRELGRAKSGIGVFNCTVVFDAKSRPIKDVPDDYIQDGVRVLFAADFDEADSLIERLIKQHSVPKKLVVVSSDHRLHKAALARKAKPVDSDQWYEKAIESEPNASSQGTSIPAVPTLSKEETAALVAKFQLPPDEINELTGSEDLDDNSGDSNPAQGFGLDQELIDELSSDLDEMNPFPPGYGEDLLED